MCLCDIFVIGCDAGLESTPANLVLPRLFAACSTQEVVGSYRRYMVTQTAFDGYGCPDTVGSRNSDCVLGQPAHSPVTWAGSDAEPLHARQEGATKMPCPPARRATSHLSSLSTDKGGCWCWSSASSGMHQLVNAIASEVLWNGECWVG